MLDHEVHSKLIDFTTTNYNNIESTSEVINYIGRNIKYLNLSDCESLNKIKNIFMKDEKNNNNLETIDSYIDFIKNKIQGEPFWLYYLNKHDDPDEKKKLEKIVEMVGSAEDLHKELSLIYTRDLMSDSLFSKFDVSYLKHSTAQLIKLACFLPEDKKNKIISILKWFKELPYVPINLKQINDQNKVFEIMKFCIENKLGLVEKININDYETLGLNKDQSFEFAKLCALQDPKAGQYIIKNFKTLDQDQIFEIAKLCSKNGEVIKCIKDFGILNKNQLFEIAKLCANQSPAIITCLKDFGSFDQEQIFQIAKICAKLHAVATVDGIKNFDTLNQDQLFEIAKICAQQNGQMTAMCISDFGILDKGRLFEIAKFCINQAGLSNIIMKIVNFISAKWDKDLIFQIIKFCAQQSIEQTKRFEVISLLLRDRENWNKLKLEQLQQLFPQQEEPPESFDFNNAKKILIEYQTHNFVENPFNNVLENIMQISDPYSKQQNIWWLANTMLIFNYIKSFDQLSDEQIDWLNEQDIFVSIAGFGRPALRFQLSLCAANLACNKEGREQVSLLLQQSNTDKSIWKKLTCLLSGALMSQGVHQDIFIKENFFRSETEKPSSIFDKKENSQALVEMLIHLVLDAQLSGNEKEQILRRIINEGKDKRSKAGKPLSNKELQAEYLNNIRSVIACINFGEINQLKNSSKSLNEIAEDILKEKLHLVNVENFLSRYFAIFGESRHPSAIMTYAAKINSLNDQKATICLGNYITSTLNDTFKEERYKIDKNPHLKKLNEFNPTLLENWKKYECLKISELILDNNSIYKKTPKEWMQMKLISDNHLDLEKMELNYLKNYLISTDLEEFNQVKKNLDNVCIEQLKISKINKIERILLTLASDINADYKNLEKLDQKDIAETEIKLKTKLKNFNSQINKLKDKEMSKNLFEIKNNLNDLNNLYEKTKNENKDEIYKNENRKIISILENNIMDLEKSLEHDKEKLCKLRLQQICIQWINESEKDGRSYIKNEILIINKPDFGKLKSILEEIQKILETAPFNRPEFINDIQGKFKEMVSKKLEEEDVVVIDTDDPIDLLLCGTDVSGSCQRVEGDANLNKGLLGYLMDGKNRLLTIKSSEERSSRILARSILRLLWDGEKPVLFLENFYPDGINTKYAQALIAMARKKANSIGVPLLSQNGQGQNYNKKLMALGGPAPWEYSDSVGGNRANGIYEIYNIQSI